MFKQSIKRLSSMSPRVAVAAALIIVVVVSGTALLLTRRSSEANANPAVQPYAARLDRLDGSVGIARTEEGGEDNQLDWAEATVNTPITVGDRIYARDYAHASIALTGHNYVRLNPATLLDVLALEDRKTQFALRSGSALFDVGALDSGELYEVATPCGAVDFKEPGLYQIGMDGGAATVSVLNGLAQVVGQEGSGFISKGQVFTLTSATATEALASTLAPISAGEIVDDYYRYRYPKVYNGRYRSYDAYLADPSYYDPYRTSVSYQYLPADIPGLYDLDYYGDWVDVSGYGHCWAPRVSAGWAPFRSGYWDLDALWGPSWVSSEPWGWAPYHYGRWAFVNQRWFWVPVEVRTRAVYCPAPVAFIPLADEIAWAPLAPGEVYVPRYYDNFRPRYLASAEVVRLATAQTAFVNFNVPGAATVVPVRAFTHVIDPSTVARVDAVAVGRSRAVVDPFSVSGVRELAIRHDDGRRRIKFERREQEALDTAVVARATPEALPSRVDLAKRLRVEAAPESRREGKLKVKETAQATSSLRADGLPQPLAQSQRMSELASRAERGDKSARREMRELMRNEQRAAQGASPAARRRAPSEQSRQMNQQRKAERQPKAAPPARQGIAQQPPQQQMRQQRRAERQQQSAAAQQKQARPTQSAPLRQQQQQMRSQRKEQKRKPPEPQVQQQGRRIQRGQQRLPAQSQMGRLQEERKTQARVDQRQAMMQQQAARAQAAQRQAMMQQQAARGQAQSQAMIQQQAARSQRQAAMPSVRRTPALQGPPVKQNPGPQSGGNPGKGQRKPPQ